MNAPRRPPGGPTEWRPAAGWLALAVGLVAGVLAYAWLSSPGDDGGAAHAPQQVAASAAPASPSSPSVDPPSAALAPASSAASTTTAAVAPRIPRQRDPNGDQTPDLADYINEGERPTMGEVIQRLHYAGVYTGLGAFQPPGTRPPLVGLAVPEDFPLPEGYVRHYQATDDGQRIEPILMFSPDAQMPFPIPEDRVVTPELAPAGLPIRRIVVPEPAESGRPGR